MSKSIVHLMLLIVGWWCSSSRSAASEPVPHYQEMAFLDKVLDEVLSDPSDKSGLAVLAKIAEGRPERIDFDSPGALAVGSVYGKKLSLTDVSVRSHAFQVLGHAKRKEAVIYLEKIRQDDLEPSDDMQRIWYSARIALKLALLDQIENEHAKVVFLEETLKSAPGAGWALEELCDRGSRQSWPAMQDTYLRGNRAEDEIEFCKERMTVVNRNQDRAIALGTVLRIENTNPNLRLLTWALRQLAAMRSVAAKNELDRFSKELAGFPDHSIAKDMFRSISMEVEAVRAKLQTQNLR